MCVNTPLLLADLEVTANGVPSEVTDFNQPVASVCPTPYAQGDGAAVRRPDYGLCAFDAGLATDFRTLAVWDEGVKDRLELTPVKWPAPLEYVDDQGVTQEILHVVAPSLQWTQAGAEAYLQAHATYLGGNFGLAGEQWHTLPRRYSRGLTVEMALYVEPDTLSSISEYADGTVWYMGTRAPNKFWQVSNPDAAYRINSGIPLEESHVEDPSRGLALNALGIRLNRDASVGVRLVNERTRLEDYTSPPGTVQPGWLHLVFSWCPSQPLPSDPDIQECAPFRRGVLRLVVNGRQVLQVADVPELRLRDLETPSWQQLSVPYYMAWGGGTTGLRHAYVPADPYGTPEPLGGPVDLLDKAYGGTTKIGLRRLRVYEGAVTPLQARLLAQEYPVTIVWGWAAPLVLPPVEPEEPTDPEPTPPVEPSV